MNWIRFNGSLRVVAVSQPLDGTPLVNASIKDLTGALVKPQAADGPQPRASEFEN